jgi:hypothetical protein
LLVATIGRGTLCALLASACEAMLAKSIVLVLDCINKRYMDRRVGTR